MADVSRTTRGTAPAAALDLANLSFSYGGRFALDRVSLRVEAGVFTALLGPNGAGKTTLFSLIAHLFEPRDGAVRVGGWDMRDAAAKALARLGIVFQQPTLDLDLSVIQNLRYAARLHGIGGAAGPPADRRRTGASRSDGATRPSRPRVERRAAPAGRTGPRPAP